MAGSQPRILVSIVALIALASAACGQTATPPPSVIAQPTGAPATAAPATPAPATPAPATARPPTPQQPTPEPTQEPTPPPTPAPAARWVPAGNPVVDRSFSILVPVPGGRALLLGDDNPGLPSDGATGNTRAVDVWSRDTNSWTPTAPLNAPRANFVALPLADGRALVTGGISEWTEENEAQAYSSTKVWDPVTGRWSNAALLETAREAPFGVVLADGRVMVGAGTFADGEKRRDLTTVEIYDPVANKWTRTGSLHHTMFGLGVTMNGGPTALLLADGRVLVLGAWYEERGEDYVTVAATEIWDPATGRWTVLGDVHSGLPAQLTWEDYSAVALADGGALVMGGVTYDNNTVLHADVVRFDGTSESWSPATPLPGPRARASAVRLADGRVLLTGGQTVIAPDSGDDRSMNFGDPSTLIYDPGAGTWTQGPNAPVGRVGAPLVLLDDGSVLTAVGGTSQCGNCVPGPWVNENEPAARFVPGSP